jgi:cation-transporting ATPase E
MLFLAKTAYAILLSVIFGAMLWGFPFLPRQMSVSDGLTIGIPAFFLALMSNPRRYRSGFLKRSLSFAVPAGAVVTAAITAVHIVAGTGGYDDVEKVRTAAFLALTLVGLWILVVVSRPLDLRRSLVIAAMYAGLGLLLVVPIARDFLQLETPPPPLLIATGVIVVAAMIAIELLGRLQQRRLARERTATPPVAEEPVLVPVAVPLPRVGDPRG